MYAVNQLIKTFENMLNTNFGIHCVLIISDHNRGSRMKHSSD